MKLKIFAVGFEKLSFDAAFQMIKEENGRVLSEEEWKEFLNNLVGKGYFAAGVHLLHLWITDNPDEDIIDLAKRSSMFFRLASKEPSFKVLEGEG